MLKKNWITSVFDFAKPKNWVNSFLNFKIAKLEHVLETEDEDFWVRMGEAQSLKIFHAAARLIPAYKHFLKKHGVRPEQIKKIEDFRQLPLTDKQNYIRQYPLKDRSWPNQISNLVAVSSGTSGEPVFWPRTGFQEFEAGIVHELLYRNSFQIDKHKTLLIIGFPMGIYVSGVATLLPSFLISTKGYNLTVASVGTNKDDILRIASLLKENYEQVVLIGHPLFIKDVIETGKEKGIKWPERRTKLMFCSEGFSEKFRDYIMSRAGIKLKANVISTYGTSEMLLVAYETPASIELRELADKNLKIRNKIFGSETVPNLFQYNPLLRYIETVNNELVFTSASGIPLIRYNLHDSGRIISSRLVRKLLNHKIDWQLPFLTLHGRSDYTVIFYAANIYPEHIRASLDHSSLLKKLTGKFTMRKGYYKNMDEYLEINFELKDGEMPNKKFTLEIQKRIVAGLRKLNLEYLFLCNNLGKNLTPIIKLWSYRHEKYFQPGLKPRYITK